MRKTSDGALKRIPAPVRRAPRTRDELTVVILNAASELFASKGFAEPTIRDIANHAGVNLPTLYRVFVDKKDIYARAVQEAAARTFTSLIQSYRHTDPPEAVLYRAIKWLFDQWAHPSIDRKLVVRTLLDGDSKILDDFFARCRESEFLKATAQASIELCGQDMPFLRLMILNAFFNSIPNFYEFWKVLDIQIDIDRTDDLPQEILSIIYPKVDWQRVAIACRD